MAKKSAKATSSKRPAAAKAAPSVESLFKPFEQAGQAFGFDQAKEQFEKLGFGFFRGSDEFTTQGRENVEALVKSSQILAKSAEELAKAVTAFAQTSMELTAKAGKAMVEVKSLEDLAEVHSQLAKTSLEHFISGASKLSDMTVKVANEAFEPISQRINVAVEKASRAA